ncbi:TPA: excinuclease ABC subunit UvrC [Salmonella enterica subsp. enterica serovar Choleraesuis]|nr:excinuclease ABC subunit UvrC [Salmonella enterica subsp. enterica serovar Choleraesuis]
MSAIEVTNLVKKFHGQTVLHGIDLEVKPGEVVAIIGPSGSGKTTLLRCINLLEQPEAGTIKVGDIIIDTARPFSQQKGLIRQLRQHVGFVFQSFNLFPHRTVLENIIEGPVIVKGEPKAEATALARELLAKVGLAGKETRYPRRLSGGQQQRVAIARALAMHRGAKHAKGEYFGPFPNGYAVRETLALLQKIFPIRQCENSVYRNRSRPCLQYQIGRCLGPCVAGLVSEEEYAQQVEYVRLFLSGKDDQVLTQLIARMEKASQDLAFEEAARIRDQIQAVRRVTERQFVSNAGDDLDVIGVAFDAGMACVHVLFIRQGKVLGSRSYFPKVPGGTELGEVVETFVGQFYLQGSQMRTLPGEILLDFNLSDKTLLADSLSELAGRRIHVQTKPRGDRARYLKLARTNAATALITKLSQQSTITQRLTALAAVLKLPAIKRMECFDISHTMGEQTVASCVVFDANGPLRAEYRRYNIAGITPGDDYAAMNQVLRRRYGKAIEESKIPDVILIDGGKGQLAQAKAVFAELDVPWDKHRPLLLGVAKGADRKAGLETLFFEPEGEGFSLPPDSPALHVIQHIRDESHDHAIGGHRKKRAKVKNTSTLETIEGVGPKRRQMLLKYMGGLQGLRNASVEEIAKVPGISQGLAEKIFWSLKH